ncbi:MAG: tryptophan synthase subunit alpha [Helicobacteraceae bacterium]|jgi:tryptophan synthase alpha chain|nr:tryptophan synthase subunit alpha [Helicobacteraceae bacterium]
MKKLLGYLTPKLPDSQFTIDLALALFESGVDSLELGVPFSDPAADGPVIEQAGRKAIENGFVFDDILRISSSLRGRDLLWMGYMNSFFHRGFDRVALEAASLGVSGLLIPDMPHEESERYAGVLEQKGVALIEFIAPTTPKERATANLKNARKFVYLVAYNGITGVDRGEDDGIRVCLENIRAATKTPVFVGFGVNRDSAKRRVLGADGVIVGSAFVRLLLNDSLGSGEKMRRICEEARAIKEIINE